MNVIGTCAVLVALGCGGVLTLIKSTRWFGFLAISIAGLTIAFYLFQSPRWHKAYEKIESGISEKELIEVMGRPSRVTNGKASVPDDFTPSKSTPNCIKEYWYHAFLHPEAFSFCFDDGGKLTDKGWWASW